MSSNHNKNHSDETNSPTGRIVAAFIQLLVLTLVSVVTSYFNLGLLNVVITLAVSATQAAIIAINYLRLREDTTDKAVFVKAPFAAAALCVIMIFVLSGTRFFFPNAPKESETQENLAGAPAVVGADQNKLRIGTPELVARGKQLFHDNACYTCHGEKGDGKGVAAAALNPKPRDFTSGYWKFGGAPTQIFHTVTVGSPGTAMAPYGHLSVADRYALVHYVRSFHSPQPNDTPETLAKAGLTNGGTGVTEEAAKPEIPVTVAMEKLEVPEPQEVSHGAAPMNAQSPGAKLFTAQCMSCHGVNGAGAKTMAMGVNPSISLETKPWAGIQSSWVNNASVFDTIVTQGFPGRGMPGQATLSKQELGELYSYARELTHH